MKISESKKGKGFTIVELLVFMGIFTILIIVLTEILTSALNVQLESESISNVQQDGRFILARLIYDINRAQSHGSASQPITPPIITPAVNGSTTNTLKLFIGGKTYLYSLNADSNLTLSVDGGTADLLNGYNTRVSNLTFTRINGPLPTGPTPTGTLDTIKINFTLTSRTAPKSGPVVKNFSTTIGVR